MDVYKKEIEKMNEWKDKKEKKMDGRKSGKKMKNE